MTILRLLGAVVVGGFLAATPFLLYGVGSDHHAGAPHMDHEPRHGGYLMMVGDYHLEVVERRPFVELYWSDATRVPLGQVSLMACAHGEEK